MENVYIKGISLHRYKTSSEWDNDNTIISQGEPIVYSDAFQIDNKIIAGMKIGNGKDIAKNLSFIGGNNSGESGTVDLTNIALIGQGNSTLVSENVASFGQLNIVGQKGYKIIIPEGSTAYDSENQKTYPILPQEWINGKYYILDSVDGLAVGDVFSIRLDAHSYNHGAITSIDPQTNKVIVEPFYNQTYVKNTPYLWILAKPEAGTQDIGIAAFAAGVENKSQGYNSVALGGYNKAYGWYSTAIGSGNEVGYGAVGFGEDNKVNGTSAVGGGDSNIINAYAAVGFGVRNEVTGPAGFVAGVDNKVFARAAVALGDKNINNADGAVICGYNNENTIDAKYSAIFGQENTNKGQSSFICGKLCTTNTHLSAAIGEGIITNARAQVAVGTFNATRSGSIFLVGTGTGPSDSQRRTSFEVLTGGDTRVHGRLELRNADNTDYHIALFYATDDVLPGLFNESSNTIYGKLHMPKGKIVSQYVKCDKLQLGDKVIGGVWTPNSNGY